jgi:hypothetical protein
MTINNNNSYPNTSIDMLREKASLLEGFGKSRFWKILLKAIIEEKDLTQGQILE